MQAIGCVVWDASDMAKTVIAAFLRMLVGIMVGSFLYREFAQPTDVKIEGDNAQRTQSALEALPIQSLTEDQCLQKARRLREVR